MNNHLHASLIARAERLLMISPGAWSEKPLKWVQKKFFEMCDLEDDYSTDEICAARLRALMWHWMEACEYVLSIDDHLHMDDPSIIGIESFNAVNNVIFITVYCYDIEHFRILPSTVKYRNKQLGKTGWNINSHRCFYQSKYLISN